jgi:ribosomal protein S18 acetylase RimI-like enzyme
MAVSSPASGAREARADELPALARLLARAFRADPAWRFIVPDDAGWERHGARIFELFLARSHEIGVVLTTAAGEGVATWIPPASRRPRLRTWVSERLRLAWIVRRRALAGLRLHRAIAAAHPREPHWYLEYLGTDPRAQRRGHASAVIAPILARCDADGIPAFVATSTESNLAFYGRHGFAVVGEVDAGRVPRTWLLRRAARHS